jgi:hypothetical protein
MVTPKLNLMQNPQNNCAENLEQTIKHCQRELEVYTRDICHDFLLNSPQI